MTTIIGLSVWLSKQIKMLLWQPFKVKTEFPPKIEEEMKKIIDQDITIIRKEISKAQAKEIFKDQVFDFKQK